MPSLDRRTTRGNEQFCPKHLDTDGPVGRRLRKIEERSRRSAIKGFSVGVASSLAAGEIARRRLVHRPSFFRYLYVVIFILALILAVLVAAS